jgi:MoxR-like ATPase
MNKAIDQVLAQLNSVILGKETVIQQCVCCLVAKGHLLIEDMPGVGKTTLAYALAKTLGLSMRRIQFTNDLLPADILGNSIYNKDTGKFEFHPGPIFSQILLADEINRATPKTQSALLEAMEERQVTIDGVTHRLPDPFFVVATQNPFHQVGTYPLPESQIDRFMMRVSLGFPDRGSERAMLTGQDRHDMVRDLPQIMQPADLLELQQAAERVFVSEPIVEYILDLLEQSRRNQRVGSGLSPRVGLALRHGAQAWAALSGRDMVLPEDVQAVSFSVMSHRLAAMGQDEDVSGEAAAERLIKSVAVR